ncbi:uncharacterized protein PV07_09563 [Cladophialophora immunda]|uniref:Uncharacterized protein n=1 Tax=Cladophialophora immunda TaxID=569365 RepID=A0A0D2C7M5_9EURO|nr:uncharacterized protein PV07_09563 [Cladophialophora immunda]KIW26470.1 hypothetical protein PV07_09563 [Cladophialophora immunda]
MASSAYSNGPRRPSGSLEQAAEQTSTNSTTPQSPSQTSISSSIDTFTTNRDAVICATHFGIELEFVLAFREDRLKSIISEYNLDADVIRTLADYEHRSLIEHDHMGTNPSYECRWRHPSWALHVPETDIVCTSNLHKGMFFNKVEKGKQWVRRYVVEPLLIAQDRLGKQGLPSNVVGWLEPDPNNRHCPEAAKILLPNHDCTDERVVLRKSMIDYTEWTLTNDHTVIGVLRSQLREHLLARGFTQDDVPKWDSYGMEMISPVFELGRKTEAFSQVGKYLRALISTETSILESVWASAHVHIGFNFSHPDQMPILLLQHLAYILVLHEDLLSKCHPRSRCGIRLLDSISEEAEVEDASDDEEFDPDAPYEPPPQPSEDELEECNERVVVAFEAKYTGADNVSSNARYLRKQLSQKSIQCTTGAIRDAIFKQDGNIFDLVGLLQQNDEHGNPCRGYMYNFANLVNLARNMTTWKQIKPTVEFRQHACTLDAGELNRWVTLLERIVRVAEENAQATMQSDPTQPTDPELRSSFADREGSKYPSSSTAGTQWPCRSMSGFCVEFLGMNSEDGQYWQQRFERYKDDRPEYDDDD